MGHHHDPSDLRRLRTADDDRQQEESRRPEPTDRQGETWVGHTVIDSTYPQTPNAFYGVVPCVVTGDEVEGGQATVADNVTSVLCYNLGNAIPPVGSPVVVTEGNFRRTFSWWG